MNSRIPRGFFAFISFKNSRIPYSDPRVKLRDDIVGNSKIPNLKFLLNIY